MAIKQAGKSLASQHNPLADTAFQLKVLNTPPEQAKNIPSFSASLKQAGWEKIKPGPLEILQVNIGKVCNQSCAHCHVDAGPDRKEMMSTELLKKCLDIVETHKIPTVDITGGAPELHPHFRWFVAELRHLNCHVINRCNLTIIRSNPKYHDLPRFFAEHEVQLICSLPHYSKLRTDHQRGEGVFEDSIHALKQLNEAGYGMPDSDLILDLVYNPSGAFLPADQHTLELEFKRQLLRKFNIVFNQLYTITNLPISRFLDFLIESGNYETYMETLVEAFNPATIPGLMCRNTLSVGWDGSLYDCDFNQMLDLKIDAPASHLLSFDLETISQRDIVTNQHCYGCTAGAGSSCGGQLI